MHHDRYGFGQWKQRATVECHVWGAGQFERDHQRGTLGHPRALAVSRHPGDARVLEQRDVKSRRRLGLGVEPKAGGYFLGMRHRIVPIERCPDDEPD